MRRLAAILDYEAGRLEATPAAFDAGDSTPTFFRTLKAWKSSRSLASLVPHARIRLGEREGEGLTDDVRAAARRLVEEAGPKATKESIVSKLRAMFPDGAVPITLRKLVATEMASRRRHAAAFGRRILVDSSILDVSLPGEVTVRAMVDLVIDPDTGLVLALHRPNRNASLSARWKSLLVELERWVETAPEDWRRAQGVPDVTVVMPDLGAIAILEHLRSLPPEKIELHDTGERRTGRRAHAALTGKIGGMTLRPRLLALPGFEAVGVEGGATPPTAAEIDVLAAYNVDQHNARLLESIDQAASSPEAILQAVRETIMPSPPAAA